MPAAGGGRAQNLIRAFAFEVLAFEIFQLLPLVGRQTRALAPIAFGLADPAERFGRASEFVRDRSNRGPLGRMLVGVLKD